MSTSTKGQRVATPASKIADLTCGTCGSSTYQNETARQASDCKPQATCVPGQCISPDSSTELRACTACPQTGYFQDMTRHTEETCQAKKRDCPPGQFITFGTNSVLDRDDATGLRRARACISNQ